MKDNSEHLDKIRHSCSHLLAAAVLELYPNAKPTLGPSIENGFYYDFDFGDTQLSEEDLPKIEEVMKKLLPSWTSFSHREVDPAEAKKIFKNNEYKIELIEEHSGAGEKISLYKSGEFEDLCLGGHSENPSKEIGAFKLLSVAGAYWRGDEKNKMLTRIYGTAFKTQAELDEYLHMIEEAKKRDHRKLGRDLDLFTFSELVGSGFPLYTPRGAYIRRTVNAYVEEVQSAQDYQQVWTPQIAKAELFKTSGHYHKYKDDMFRVVSNYSDEELYLKPMNCPQHTQIYASKPKSYRDLPVRMTDFAMLYRDERPGELSGLARVRSFSQDDCHIFCMEEQVDEEIDKALQMTKKIMATFGFKYRYRLSTRDLANPDKYLGDPKTWDKVEAWAEKIMERNAIEYYPGPGEAAFYAPKMDLMATDALGREWQLSTVQIDFVMPERFNLTYVDKEGKEQHPVMLHRAIVGSPERFLMILLEHFSGALPLWLAPDQVKIIPVSDKFLNYANSVKNSLVARLVQERKEPKISVDDRSERLQSRIRDAELLKVPYILVVGGREEESSSVGVRVRHVGDKGSVSVEEFGNKLVEEIRERKLELWK